MAWSGSKDMVDRLIEDHREVEQLFQDLESRSGTAEQRRQQANVVIAELVRHSVAEEQYLYPTARQALDDGNKIADHEIAEHAEAERVMKRLEGTEATEPEFDRLVDELIADVRHHIAEEEGELFPRLRQTCTTEELVELGAQLQSAKGTAPTRPHPSAPDTPPANKLLAPASGLVDKVRDALQHRATKAKNR
jgi:hemerythrin-like domain-containing protein